MFYPIAFSGNKATFKRKARAPKRRTYRKRSSGIKKEYHKLLTGVSIASNSTGAIKLVNAPIQGDDYNHRTGRMIDIKSLNFKFISKVTAGTGVDQLQRVIVFVHLKPHGTAPAVTDLLQTAEVHSMRNPIYIGDFRVLYDKVFNLNATAESGSTRFGKFYKKMSLITRYNTGNAGTIADIEDNALYIMTVGTEAAGATAGTVLGSAQIDWLE